MRMAGAMTRKGAIPERACPEACRRRLSPCRRARWYEVLSDPAKVRQIKDAFQKMKAAEGK